MYVQRFKMLSKKQLSNSNFILTGNRYNNTVIIHRKIWSNGGILEFFYTLFRYLYRCKSVNLNKIKVVLL